jgi:hypothetical protein
LNYYRERGLLQTVDGDRNFDTVSADLVRVIETSAKSIH